MSSLQQVTHHEEMKMKNNHHTVDAKRTYSYLSGSQTTLNTYFENLSVP